jgi:hypothetical protein
MPHAAASPMDMPGQKRRRAQPSALTVKAAGIAAATDGRVASERLGKWLRADIGPARSDPAHVSVARFGG